MRPPPPRHRRVLHRPRAARLVRLGRPGRVAPLAPPRHRRMPPVRRPREALPLEDPPARRSARVTRTRAGQASAERTVASTTGTRTRAPVSPRTGAKRTVMYYIKQLPG